jgi:hypothetical protein
VPTSTETKRLILRKLAADASASGASLSDTLNAAAFGTVTFTLSGKVLVEARGEGTVARYELLSAVQGIRPQDVQDTLSQLLDLYDAAVSASATGASDTVLLAYMLGQIVPIRAHVPDFSNTGIRW